MNTLRRRAVAVAGAAITLGVGVGLLATGSEASFVMGVGAVAGLLGGVALAVVLLGTSWTTPGISADDTAWLEFRRELRRARRHDRPLTLVRIPLEDPEVDAATTARLVGDQLRLIDRAWVDGDSVFVMLPESPRSAARPVISRASDVAPGAAVAGIRVASFPEDGLTSGALMSALFEPAADLVPIPIRPASDDASAWIIEDGAPLPEIAQQR